MQKIPMTGSQPYTFICHASEDKAFMARLSRVNYSCRFLLPH